METTNYDGVMCGEKVRVYRLKIMVSTFQFFVTLS